VALLPVDELGQGADVTPEHPAAGPVLVTGGAGFIGTALVRALLAADVAVSVVDLRAFPDPAVDAIVGDLRDDAVLDAIADRQPSAVFHLAARTSVLQSVPNPVDVYENNVGVTQRLLEAARVSGTSAFVLASTNAVAGGTAIATIDEQTALRPLTPYGATKAAAEMLCSAYSSSYGMTAAPVRLTNVYGPGMTEKDSFIARLMRAAANGSEATIYGDGEQVRDYLYVADAVAGLLLAWRQRLREPVVIGSGTSTSVIELYELVRSVTEQPLDAVAIEPPRGEMRAVRVNITHARSLGYEPSVDLREGLTRTWDSWRSHLDPHESDPP
jgi:UDP-glucose 4-epimerase